MIKLQMEYTHPIPSFIDGQKLLFVWHNEDEKVRIFVYQRSNGTIGRECERFSDHEYEMCWIPIDRGHYVYGSTEIAETEIKAEFL